MNISFFNFPLAVFWFILFLGMITRETWMPEELLAKFDTPQSPLVSGILLMMAFWNLSRYWRAKRHVVPTSRISEEMKQKIRGITGVDHKVTDPQFNFDDPDTN